MRERLYARQVDTYAQALVSAWRMRDRDTNLAPERPFVMDTTFDLTRVVDWIVGFRTADADVSRIGAIGVSLGGMEAWMGAAADPRIALTVLIAVQFFRWRSTTMHGPAGYKASMCSSTLRATIWERKCLTQTLSSACGTALLRGSLVSRCTLFPCRDRPSTSVDPQRRGGPKVSGGRRARGP